MDVQKLPKGTLLYIFRHYAIYRILQKKIRKSFGNSFQFFLHAGTVEEKTWHFEVLLLFLSLRYDADLGRSRLVFLILAIKRLAPTDTCLNDISTRMILFIFRPHKWGREIMIWTRFFTNSAKTPLYLHSIEWSALHLLLSQPVGRGFEPRLVLEIFSCFPASRSWVRSSPPPYFFCNKSVAENIPVLSGRLVCFKVWFPHWEPAR